MRKSDKDNPYSGIEDYSSKRDRKKRGEETFREDSQKQPHSLSKGITPKRVLLGLIPLVLLILLSVILFRFVFTNEKETAEEQLFKLVKANTDREYNQVGGLKTKGRDMWVRLGEIDEKKFEFLSKLGQQSFVEDVIAAARKAIAEDSIQIGDTVFVTKDVTSDTVKAWLKGMSDKENLEDKLWDCFTSDTQPAFIPVDSSGYNFNRTKWLLVALLIFVLICVFFPRKKVKLSVFIEMLGSRGGMK